jgi:hypothetical protein
MISFLGFSTIYSRGQYQNWRCTLDGYDGALNPAGIGRTPPTWPIFQELVALDHVRSHPLPRGRWWGQPILSLWHIGPFVQAQPIKRCDLMPQKAFLKIRPVQFIWIWVSSFCSCPMPTVFQTWFTRLSNVFSFDSQCYHPLNHCYLSTRMSQTGE